jgi:tRNA1Val (adenine37-N6)-methyltransferase
MTNSFFKFKRFTVQQDRTAMKVTTDACLFGAWVANEVKSNPASGGTKIKNVLDVGTGTGLLSLMFAQKSLSSFIDAIEIDKEACEQAEENVFGSPFATQITLINDDAKIFPFRKKYDIIISNPPFYENELKSIDQKKNIAHHHSGLLLSELLSVVKSNLATNGKFYLLLPYKRNDEIKALFEKDLSILKIIFVRQSTKHDYFRIMLCGESKDENDTETMIDEISIWNDEQEYTNAFKELLKDYYLSL